MKRWSWRRRTKGEITITTPEGVWVIPGGASLKDAARVMLAIAPEADWEELHRQAEEIIRQRRLS